MLIRSSPSELLHQIKDSTASLVFVHPSLLSTLDKSLALPNAPRVHIILLCTRTDRPKHCDYKCIDELWQEPIQPAPVDPAATAYLCYSSGTTGLAKGVETSHHNITSQIQVSRRMSPLIRLSM
jgi:long-subunit acyl-CoA synthetase (AMP-forming)